MSRLNYILRPLLPLLLLGLQTAAAQTDGRKVYQAEKRADRLFLDQNFDKAMGLYEQAVSRSENTPDAPALHLKAGRLYFMIRDYPMASYHYGKAIGSGTEYHLVGDICNYIDALRFQGRHQEAETVAHTHAYRDIYSRYQRYQNMVNALWMRGRSRGITLYDLRTASVNSGDAEFWVGRFDGELFYARSHSSFNDPGKLFFHNTKYYTLNDTGKQKPEERNIPAYADFMKSIPPDLQSGPVCFSDDMSMMITTRIEYTDRSKMMDIGNSVRPFKTKLVYSCLRDGRNRYTRYEPLFPQDENASYAHPFLFNEGRSLLFSTDMEGGYGGFDIYITHWEDGKWGSPINLGPGVNTEGDEIYPVLSDGVLIFSSNGHPGSGGYDIFNIMYEDGAILAGSLRHYPYPINTEYNDFYMLPVDELSGYLASDRNLDSHDDLFYYTTKRIPTKLKGDPFFGLNESEAMLAGTAMVRGDTEADIETSEMYLWREDRPMELLLTVYFDFDKWQLTAQSRKALTAFMENTELRRLHRMEVLGYADETGTDEYNLVLSEKRAYEVLNFIRATGDFPPIPVHAEGKGKLRLTPEEIRSVLFTDRVDTNAKFVDRVKMNSKARKVEIYGK